MYYLGVDLGGTNIKAALVDADGAIIKEASTPTKLPRPAEAVCDDIAALCNQLAQGQQVAGIGVGCPGTVDGGLVRYSNNLDWHDFAMGDYLRAKTGLPVALANDANAAALGEALAGCAKGAESAVIITLGTGVGGGVVLGGKLLTGYTGAAAEPGHMVILDTPDAPRCTCGRPGCLESLASATALIRMAARKRLEKRALVLGAGPVGCAGAETLALAGYEVFLCDMDGEKARAACGALSGCTPCTPDGLSGLPLFECLLDAAPTNDFFPLDRLAAGACISAPCVPCIWTLRAPEGASVWHDPLQLGTAVMLLAAAFGRP